MQTARTGSMLRARPIVRIAWIVVTILVCRAPAQAQGVPDPEALGPYPVGVTTLQLDDHGRADPETGGPRSLLTEIWYPATDDARSLPKNKYSEFILRGVVPGSVAQAEAALGGYREGFTIEAIDETFENIAVRDARVRGGRWPLLLFSHGSGGTRVGYVYFTEFMASHGFIVMSADHTGNSRFTLLDGKVIERGGERAQRSANDRPNDLSFLLDSMTKMNLGADSRFAGRVAVEQVAAAGMSFGGSTTMRVLNQDPRIKAGVMLAPGGAADRTDYTTPIMMMIGTEDATIRERGNARSRQYYAESQGARYLVEIKDAGHFSFTSVDQYNPNYGNGIGTGVRITAPGQPVTYLSPEETHRIIDAYALAFLSVYVRGETGYKAFLETNHYGDEIIYAYAH